MTATTCARCERPTPDGLPLCVTCGTELVKALYGVPAVVADIWVMRCGEDRFTDGGASSEAPLPIRPAKTGTRMVGDLELERLTNTVTGWWRVIAESNGITPADPARRVLERRTPGRPARVAVAERTGVRHDPDTGERLVRGRARFIQRHPTDIPIPVTDVERAAVWLSEEPSAIRRHEAAAQLADEIITAVAEARRITDRPREMRPIGPCPTVLEDGSRCGTALLVDVHEPPDYVRCRTCREQAPVAVVEQSTLHDAEDLCWTRPELMIVLDRLGEHVSRGTLDSWVSRGQLVEAMRNAEGERMFRLGDVRKLRAQGRQDEGGTAA